MEWKEAQVVRGASRSLHASPCLAWHPSPSGRMKLNVDAAFFSDTQQTGIGLVLRDELGNFIKGRTKIKEMNRGDIIVEGDAKIVVDAINSSLLHNSVFGDCIDACKSILLESPGVSVVFVKMSANVVAHQFVRVSCHYGCYHSWIDPPSFVFGLPFVPCFCNNES
ncbi:hypothetical protein ACS0TY_013220 [Phlomoides rotata]